MKKGQISYKEFLIWMTIIFGLIGLLCLIITLIFVVTNKEYFTWFGKLDLKNSSYLGAFIGGFIGVFWTAAGLFLLVLTFNEQRIQFKATQFESTFFNLLNHLNDLIISTSGSVHWANISDGNVSGRKYFYYTIREFDEQVSKDVAKYLTEEKNDEYKEIVGSLMIKLPEFRTKEDLKDFDLKLFKKYILEQFETSLKNKSSQLNHYFKFVSKVMDFIDSYKLDFSQRQKYIEILEAQMTNDELWLLFFHGLNQENDILFRQLEKYHFFKNLSKGVIDWCDIAKLLYSNIIFNNL